MGPESDQDLPSELLDKLRNLELELEDGDITKKGFEKKKATLLQQYAPSDDHRRSTGSTSTQEEQQRQQADAQALEELGPEPSAADVVDFLDYLPSPTHSPPKHDNQGAAFMEQNHRQQTPPAPPVQPVPSSQPIPQQQYYPYQQQSQWQQQHQMAPQPMYNGQQQQQYYAHGGMATSPRPTRAYDPRMPPPPSSRPPPTYQGAPQQTTAAMRHPGMYSVPQQRPHPSTYRPASTGTPPFAHQQQRPMYTSRPMHPPPPQQSPRPVYRTGQPPPVRQQPPPSSYRPPPVSQPQMMVQGRTSSLDARASARPAYNTYARPPPQHHVPRNIPPPPEGWRG
ncbi:hypothetical protein LRAMOSA04879 [Lichtheimia ramosa]|uniref:DMAP1-binding domain-containing protein n=1 Tax=Lichtheimia ramosa TaxID=688394 RepID=A0A077X0F1_9FUNG|nr:hypothetical protein LRAMOSA04879 [Lichtheimia ramosa]